MTAIITVLVALYSELTTAIFTGVILSLTLYTLTMADTLKVFALERVAPGTWREVGPDNIVWRDPILGRAIDVAYDRAAAALAGGPPTV